MKLAILGDSGPGYICPMMTGLDRMLRKLDCDTALFPHGIKMLSESSGIKGWVKHRVFAQYMSSLSDCDAILVVQHLRDAFRPSLRIEELRSMFPRIPVILYDLVYLPTVGLWGPWLNPDGPDPVLGLDRYDWYLCASTHNRLSIPPEEQPCTEIGLDLDDGSLFPEQRGTFRALIDFEREAYPDERQIQLEALRETGTDFTILSGRYSIADIRAIYRTCSLYIYRTHGKLRRSHLRTAGLRQPHRHPLCRLVRCTPPAGAARSVAKLCRL